MPSRGPESPSESPLAEKSSVRQIFESLLKIQDGKPEFSEEERAQMAFLETEYGKNRLEVVLETRSEILHLQDEIQARLGDQSLSIEDIRELKPLVESLARKEAAEDRINALGGVEGIETVQDLRELSADQLIALEDEHEGVLLYAFTDFVEDSTQIDVERFDAFYRSPTIGTRLKVNFRGNAAAEASIGAADLFPPSVRRITVYYGGNVNDKRTSERRIGLKGQNKSGNGFFDGDGYIPVYSGDEVIVESGGVDIDFDRNYRKTPSAGQTLGELDYDKYQKEFGDQDVQFLNGLPPGARQSKYHHGASFSRAHREALGLDAHLGRHSKNIEAILRKTPDLYTYAHKTREKYRNATGIDIDESIMFGVIQLESGFRVDVLNREGSGAGGLFQFIPSTWNSYLRANPWVYERMAKDPTWSRVDQMDWRFNPEIMIDAGYWLATQNMKSLYDRKTQITLREFANSEFYRSGTVTANDAWLLYLPHHDGADGAVRLLKYASLREQGVDARTAEARVGLKAFQKHRHHFKGGKTIYNYDSFIADRHWKQLRGYAQRNVKLAKKYRGQLDVMGAERLHALENGPGTWGWGEASTGKTLHA